MLSRAISLLLLTALAGFADPAAPAKPTKGLTVTVLQGDNVVNSLPNAPPVFVTIRAADAQGAPVKDAVVVCELPEEGASAAFLDHTHVNAMLTNKDGEARFQLHANEIPGNYQAKLHVNYLGQTNLVTLNHENAINPDVRPPICGHGLIAKARALRPHHSFSKKIWLVLGGAAIVAVVAIVKAKSSHSSSGGGGTGGGGITITPGPGTVGGNG